MKLIDFHGPEGIRAGLVRDGGVQDLAASDLWQGPAPVVLNDIAALATKFGAPPGPLVPIESLRLAPVVVAPEKILCVGLNYRRHAVEANMPIPATPVIFGKFANSLSASGDRVALASVDHKYDYEAELGVIIGREARDVTVDQALGYVAGYCCGQRPLRSRRPTRHQPVDDRQDARRVPAARPVPRYDRRHPRPAGSQDPVPGSMARSARTRRRAT